MAADSNDRRRKQWRASIASTIGSSIEWYDFSIYGTVAVLVFPHLFFPDNSPATALLASFSTIFVGFLARPIGGAIFGHYGDRIGRKSTLILTILLMGISTILIGCLPTYGTLGPTAGILLVLLRFVQGIGVGGEWAGSVLLSMEWHEGERRGFFASLPHLGVPIGLVTSIGAIKLSSSLSGDDFLTVGWRYPFLISAFLLSIGIFMRLRVQEPPAFEKTLRENRVEAAPVLEAIKTEWPNIILVALARLAEQGLSYVLQVFIVFYCTTALDMSRDFVLNAILAAAFVSLVTVPLFGWLSDLLGRRATYIAGCLLVSVLAVPYFLVLDTKIPILVLGAIVGSMIVRDMMYGPQAAFVTENFPARIRYSASSLGYQGASLIAGGPAPLISLWLYQRFHTGLAVAAYLIVCGIGSSFAAFFLGKAKVARSERALEKFDTAA
jgi:MFS family permease